MTADEFFDFAHRPENRDKHLELERGRIVEMSLPGERHGVVCGNVTGMLANFTFHRRHGYVCANNTGIIVEYDPDSVRCGDVTLYDEVRRYVELHRKYSDRAPTLLIEVLSQNDGPEKVLRRVLGFLAMGVALVWVIEPESRTLTVYRAGKEPVNFTAAEEVTGEEVLPDLRCKVADFFALPGE